MAEINFKEYSKQRDIAQKRIKRAIAKGYDIAYRVPTVQELRDDPSLDANQEFKRLTEFLEFGVSLSRERVYSTNPKAVRSRRYRRERVAREYAREDYPTKYLEYLKGLDTLGIDIPPSQLPAFFAYMDYRFGQGKKAESIYLFDQFADDFKEMITKGYRPDQILSDFKKFEADQLAIQEKADGMKGTDYERANKIWNAFKNKTEVDW